jgi:hypothetical protein
MLLANKNIQYNDENLHFCKTHISYPTTEKYCVEKSIQTTFTSKMNCTAS